jgi:uncharacterized membrane protein/uncharacterized RDD family membrane protein YckC
VVGALGIANDILQTVLFLVVPPLLWLVLLWIAWTHPALARTSGFTRPIFWLLLPGAIVGTFGNLPLFYWNGDVLALDLGGAAIPLILSCWLLARAFGDRALLWATFFAAFGAQCVLAFVGEFEIAAGASYEVFLVVVCGATVVGMAILSGAVDPTDRPTVRRVAGLLLLSDAALVATFLSTQALPGYGIVSVFPWFLAIPLALGAVAAGVAGPMFDRPPHVGLGIGYAITTFGVLIGADLLRQPPLYGSSGYILSIGGAGTDDLVFLSGLLAVAAGLVTLRIARSRPEETDGWEPSYARREPPRPGPILRQSLQKAVDGEPKPSLALSQEAVRVAEVQARLLLRTPTPAGSQGLDGLPAPPWMVADWQNLQSLAGVDRPVPRDSTRGWLTARWLVRFLTVISARRFASFSRRALAFLLDLVVITIPGLLLWEAAISWAPGSAVDVLASVPVNAAVYLYAAAGFLYFVLAEATFGTTLGKWLLHLEVRDRTLRVPDGISSILRNLPKLIPLTTVGIGGVAALALATRGLPGGTSGFLDTDVATGVYLLIAVAGVGVPGLVSLAVMSVSPESQRLGDWFAGTWVVNEAA